MEAEKEMSAKAKDAGKARDELKDCCFAQQRLRTQMRRGVFMRFTVGVLPPGSVSSCAPISPTTYVTGCCYSAGRFLFTAFARASRKRSEADCLETVLR